jgi:hypothetical protein
MQFTTSDGRHVGHVAFARMVDREPCATAGVQDGFEAGYQGPKARGGGRKLLGHVAAGREEVVLHVDYDQGGG